MRRIPKSNRHKKLKSVDPEARTPNKKNPFNSHRPSHRSQTATHCITKRQKESNARPPDGDCQEVPRRLQDLIKSKIEAKQKTPKRVRKKKRHDPIIVVADNPDEQQYGMTRPLKPLPNKLVQMEYESDTHFLHRMEQLAGEALAEARLETKFGLEVGNVEGPRSDVRKISGRRKEKRRLLEQKQRAKKRAQRESRKDDFECLQDKKPAFGDVVLEPPTFALSACGARVRLQHPQLSNLQIEGRHSVEPSRQHTKAGLTGKVKNPSVAERQQLERERHRAIAFYRKMKGSKQLQQRHRPQLLQHFATSRK